MKRLVALPLALSVALWALPAFAGKKAPTPETKANVVTITFFPPEDGMSAAEVRDPSGALAGGLIIDSLAKRTVFGGPLHTEGGQTHQTIFIEDHGVAEQGELTFSRPSQDGMMDGQALKEGYGHYKKQSQAPGAVPFSHVTDHDGYPIEDAIKQELAARLRKQNSDVIVMTQDLGRGYQQMNFFVGLLAAPAGDAMLACSPVGGFTGGQFNPAYLNENVNIFSGLKPKSLCPAGLLDFKAVQALTERAFKPAPRDGVKGFPGAQNDLKKGLQNDN